LPRTPKKPNQAVAIALLQAGPSAEESLKIAGYNFSSADGARSKASKLLRQAPTLNLPAHPAVAALSPEKRAIFARLAPQVQAWLLDNPDPEQLGFELADPQNVEMLLHMQLTGDLAPGGKWDRIAKGVRSV
jgi:hypothetical protein